MSKAYYSEFYPLPSASGVAGTTLPATRNNPRGDWTSLPNGTQLNVGDIVTYFGSAFTVLATHNKSTSATPDVTPANYQVFVEAGTDGTPQYPWFVYADDATGSTNFTTGAPGNRTYIGVAYGTTPTESTNPAVYSWQKVTGSDAKTLVLVSNVQSIYYDSAGAPTPTVQTVAFTANRQNTTNAVTWSITDINGIAQSSTYLTSQTATTCQLTQANFALARNGTTGVIVKATITDGTTFFDTLNILRVAQGATGTTGNTGSPGATGAQGPAGPTLNITARNSEFVYVDNVLTPAVQYLQVTGTLNGVDVALTWNLRTPTYALIRSEANGQSFINVSGADIGANDSIIVEAVYNATTVATVTLTKKFTLSTDAQNTIAYNADNARDINNALLNISLDGTISKKDKTQYVIPTWATIQSNYVKYRAEGVTRGVSVVAFDSAYNALNVYIASYSTMLNPNKATYATNDFNNYVANYFKEEAALVAAANNASAQTSTWVGVTGSSKPADNAGTTVTLVGTDSSIVVQGNKATKVGYAWGQSAYINESYKGSCILSGKVTANSNLFILALHPDIPPANYGGSLQWGWYCNGLGVSATFLVNGSYVGGGPVLNAGDWVVLEYDGVTMRWSRNGVVVKEVTVDVTRGFTYRALVAIHSGDISDVNLTPSNKSAFLDLTGEGVPSPNAGTSITFNAFSPDLIRVGNSIKHISYGVWHSYWALETVQNAAFMSARLASGTGLFIFGLSPIVAPSERSEAHYALSLYAQNGVMGLYSSATDYVYSIGTIAPGDIWSVECDNVIARFLQNGALRYTFTLPASLQNRTWRVGGAIYSDGIESVLFGQGTDNLWANTSGTGRPQDFATVGSRVGTNSYDVDGVTVLGGNELKNSTLSIETDLGGTAGRARVNLKRGPTYNSVIELPSAVQNKDQSWVDVNGTGKPQDYATVGTPAGYTVAYGAFFGDDGSSVLAERNRTQKLTQAGRGADGRFLNSSNNFGLRSLNDAPVITDTDNGSSVTLNVPAMTFYPDWGGSITFPAGSIAGGAYNTRYFVYRNQADPSTIGESWGVSTDLVNALGTGKVYVGNILTRSAAGAPPPPPPPTPNYDDPGYCVVCEAFVPTTEQVKLAYFVTEDDTLIILDENTMEGTTTIEVESNEIGFNRCVKIRTETGIELTLSHNTPMTLKNGDMILAANCLGYNVPVLDHNQFRWEKVESVIGVGTRSVSRIRCYQSVYAAGNEKDRYILTHNPLYYRKP
jgi:hypothetical protein